MDETLIIFTKTLKEGLDDLNLAAPEAEVQKMASFFTFLLSENEKYNLTAITDPYEAALKHFIDSLFFLEFLPPQAKIADVGSGAGFPGLVLASFLPQSTFTLIETSAKKAAFLEEATGRLSLTNCFVLNKRAEEAGQDDAYRETFDVVVARSVAPLNVLAEFCLPLVKPDGVFIAAKGPAFQSEIKEAEKAVLLLGGKLTIIKEKRLPFLGHRRFLLLFQKVRPTPLNYPRRPGVAKKRPL